jgi:taurine--2-oxoglutarate transaminase
MCGIGRTGKMYAFEHFDDHPDIVTSAKGLTSAYLPLGMMGVRDKIADHFRKNVFSGGLTYNAHPVCLATADAVLDVLLDEGLMENAARLEHVMRREMDRLQGQAPVGEDGPLHRPVRHDGRAARTARASPSRRTTARTPP